MYIDNLFDLKKLVDYIRPIGINITLDGVWYYIGKGEKINAIKMYRQITGEGLKESKLEVEKMMNKIGEFSFY